MNCGASANAQMADDLPPTVIGMMPPIPLPNQPNQAQNQPNFGVQNQPNQFQNQPSVLVAPKKSSLLKVLLIGGIVGLLVVVAVGFLLYVKVIDPYLYQQKVEKRERDNQLSANGYSANALLPESVTSNSQTFKRGQVIDKFQLFQLTKDLPPEMKSEIKDINDAAAADYTNAANQKLALQIFKYNSPEKAKNACANI